MVQDPRLRRADERLIRNDGAVDDACIDDHVEDQRGHVGRGRGRIGTHRTRRRIFGRVNQDAVAERRDARRSVGTRHTVQRGASRDVL